MQTNIDLFDFPCSFPIKVMGEAHGEFLENILVLVQQHAPETLRSDVDCKNSKTGRYLSLTININAQSREQLDNLYRQLSSHPQVKVVL